MLYIFLWVPYIVVDFRIRKIENEMTLWGGNIKTVVRGGLNVETHESINQSRNVLIWHSHELSCSGTNGAESLIDKNVSRKNSYEAPPIRKGVKGSPRRLDSSIVQVLQVGLVNDWVAATFAWAERLPMAATKAAPLLLLLLLLVQLCNADSILSARLGEFHCPSDKQILTAAQRFNKKK